MVFFCTGHTYHCVIELKNNNNYVCLQSNNILLINLLATMTCYGLDSPEFKSRCGRDFLHLPGAHPASYTMDIRSFLGVKRPPTPIQRRGQRKSGAIPLLHLWSFVACSWVNYTFTGNKFPLLDHDWAAFTHFKFYVMIA
jgi:hypothetical protein